MVTRLHFSKLSALRRSLDEYVTLIGPGGIAAYAASQDLLLVTDLYSALVVSPATTHVKVHKLHAISSYTHRWGEFPGVHILDDQVEHTPEDIRLKSLIGDKCIYINDLIPLLQAQVAMPLNKREKLRQKRVPEHPTENVKDTVVYNGSTVLGIDIWRGYATTLLECPAIKCYSGVLDSFTEPTVSWRNFQTKDKGVFFLADQTFYGTVMPHTQTTPKT